MFFLWKLRDYIQRRECTTFSAQGEMVIRLGQRSPTGQWRQRLIDADWVHLQTGNKKNNIEHIYSMVADSGICIFVYLTGKTFMAHGSFNKNKYVVKKIIHKYNPLCETSVPRVLFSKASCMIYTAIHIYGYAFY